MDERWLASRHVGPVGRRAWRRLREEEGLRRGRLQRQRGRRARGGPVVAAAAGGASHADESYSHSENARSYTANGSDDGSKVDGTSPAIIAQVSELLNDKILHSTLWVNRSWRLMVCMENSGVPIQLYV